MRYFIHLALIIVAIAIYNKHRCRHKYERIERRTVCPNIANPDQKNCIIYIERCSKCGKIRKQKVTLY